jgi:hypothetical protein
MGRFQAWAGTQNAAKPKAGVRELSYEEALQSSRYRWPVGERASAKKNQPSAAPATKQETKQAAPQTRRKSTATVEREDVAREIRNIRTRNLRTQSHAAKNAAASAVKPEPKSTPKAFREALEEAVQPTELVTAQPAELGRQVAISIRLAPAERALIKTRAAEAGITASAYIRQCALEVEQLRTQVRETILALELGAASAVAPMSPPASPSLGFFARLRRLFVRRSPAIALRA